MRGFQLNLFHIFKSYNLLAMNFQNWRMNKYITVKVAIHLLHWNLTTNGMALC
jgi:hypothetical protein